jgi:hypothetical protein
VNTAIRQRPRVPAPLFAKCLCLASSASSNRSVGRHNRKRKSTYFIGGKKRDIWAVCLGLFFSRNPHRVMLRRRHRHPACALTSDDVPVRGAWARHEESNRARCRETERMPPPCVVASSWKTPRVQLSKVCSCLSQSRWFNHQCADEIQSFQSYIWSRSKSSGSAPPAAYMLIIFTIFFFSCKQA